MLYVFDISFISVSWKRQYHLHILAIVSILQGWIQLSSPIQSPCHPRIGGCSLSWSVLHQVILHCYFLSFVSWILVCWSPGLSTLKASPANSSLACCCPMSGRGCQLCFAWLQEALYVCSFDWWEIDLFYKACKWQSMWVIYQSPLSLLTFVLLASPFKRNSLPSSMFMRSPSKAGPSMGFGDKTPLGAKAALNCEDNGNSLVQSLWLNHAELSTVRVLDGRNFNFAWDEDSLMKLSGRPYYNKEPDDGALVLVAWTASRYGTGEKVNLGCNLNWIAILNDAQKLWRLISIHSPGDLHCLLLMWCVKCVLYSFAMPSWLQAMFMYDVLMNMLVVYIYYLCCYEMIIVKSTVPSIP